MNEKELGNTNLNISKKPDSQIVKILKNCRLNGDFNFGRAEQELQSHADQAVIESLERVLEIIVTEEEYKKQTVFNGNLSIKSVIDQEIGRL